MWLAITCGNSETVLYDNTHVFVRMTEENKEKVQDGVYIQERGIGILLHLFYYSLENCAFDSCCCVVFTDSAW